MSIFNDIFGFDARKDELISKLRASVYDYASTEYYDREIANEARRCAIDYQLKYTNRCMENEDRLAKEIEEKQLKLDVANKVIKLKDIELSDCMHKLIDAQHRLLGETI